MSQMLKTEQQETSSKHIIIRIHHLSNYKIELTKLSDNKPYMINITFKCINFLDTSNNKQNMIEHVEKLIMGPHSCMKVLTRITRSKQCSTTEMLKSCPYDFEDLFLTLESHMLPIIDVRNKLATMKVYKKRLGKTMDAEKKYTYKSEVKKLSNMKDIHKSEVKRIMVELFS